MAVSNNKNGWANMPPMKHSRDAYPYPIMIRVTFTKVPFTFYLSLPLLLRTIATANPNPNSTVIRISRGLDPLTLFWLHHARTSGEWSGDTPVPSVLGSKIAGTPSYSSAKLVIAEGRKKKKKQIEKNY